MQREVRFGRASQLRKCALFCAAAALSLVPIERDDAIAANAYDARVVRAEFGSSDDSVTVKTDDVQAKITLSGARIYNGQQLHVVIDFAVAPGWHIYGVPLPEGYTATTVKFDDALVSSQAVIFPKPTPVKFEVLGETLPVYQGEFKASGVIRLKQQLPPGEHKLAGTLEFQECNDTMCKMPRTVRFEVPFRVEPRAPVVQKQ